MPKILLVKTSSMGDVIHNLPVVSDILAHFPEAEIDWVVEESFAGIPALHPGVGEIIKVAVRRWRRTLFRNPLIRPNPPSPLTGEGRGEGERPAYYPSPPPSPTRGEGVVLSCAVCAEVSAFVHRLRSRTYDVVLDSQGLIKSALITRLAQGARCGFDWHSAREPLASLFYDKTVRVEKDLHAVERNRLLAGRALGYLPDGPVSYGIKAPILPLPWLPAGPFAVLLHATSRDAKLWPEAGWIALGVHLNSKRIGCILPWGSDVERQRSLRLAESIPHAVVPPALALDQAAALLSRAVAAVGVDTGLIHLAAALNVPAIAIYCASDPGLTGLHASGKAINLGAAGAPPDAATVIAALGSLAPL